MKAAFVILLTFVFGPGAANERAIPCETQLCAAMVLMHARECPELARVRVFEGDPGNIGHGATVSRPIIDEWLS